MFFNFLGFNAGFFVVISTHMREIGQELFQVIHHCWLEDIRNLKINDRKIATYFWYLWIFLTLPQVSYFWYVFGFQVALQSFSLKVGILSWNFLWTILLWKKLVLRAYESIFCPKIRSKFGKTRKTIVFTSSLKIKNGQIFWEIMVFKYNPSSFQP